MKDLTDHDLTTQVVMRFFGAIGTDGMEYTLQADEKNQEHLKPTLLKEFSNDIKKLSKLVSFFKAKNTWGEGILIRTPVAVLLDDVKLTAIQQMKADGVEPAAVVQTSPGNFQAWIKLSSDPLSEETRKAVSRLLTARYGADTAAVGSLRWGRLPGFTNRKPKHQRPDGRFPFVLLKEATGQVASKGAEIVAEAVAKDTKRTESAKSRTVPTARFANDADGLLSRFSELWQKWEMRQSEKLDYSQGDFFCACRLYEEGADICGVKFAIRCRSPRLEDRHGLKGQEDYCSRTAYAAAAKVGYEGPENTTYPEDGYFSASGQITERTGEERENTGPKPER